MTAPTRGDRPPGTPAAVIVLFEDRDTAERAVGGLRDAGYTEDQIGVAMRDRSRQPEPNATDAAPVAEGVAVGALTGGVFGGLLALLGSLLIPGVGPIVAGGILGSALVGAGIGAATGGIVGALVSMGATEEEARYFDQGFRNGRVLVTVDAPDRADEARQILRTYDADFGPSGRTGAARAAGASTSAGGSWRGTERRIARDISYAGPERRQTVL